MNLNKFVGIFLSLCVAIILAGFGTKTTVSTSQSSAWPKPSRYVKDIAVYEKFSDLEALFHFKNDSTYVINFWATWCKPCVAELPYFEQLQEKYKDEKLRVVFVSLDFPRQLESKLIPFLEKNQMKSTVLVLLDGSYNDWINKVSPEWSGVIPATLVYAKDKRTFTEEAFESLGDLEAAIK